MWYEIASLAGSQKIVKPWRIRNYVSSKIMRLWEKSLGRRNPSTERMVPSLDLGVCVGDTLGAPYGIKRKRMCIVETLTLAANDAEDLRSWSKVLLRDCGGLVPSIGTIERSVRVWARRMRCSPTIRKIRVGGIVRLFSWKRGKCDNDP